MASERSERDTYRGKNEKIGDGVDNAKSGICYWRASVASETLTGVTQSKIGDVCLFIYLASERSERDTYRGNTIENRGCLFIYLFIYMFGRMYVILYFDPPYFCVRSAFDPVPNFTKQNPLV